jgi:hypothetical protein
MIMPSNENPQKQTELTHLDSITTSSDGKHSDHTFDEKNTPKDTDSQYISGRCTNTSLNSENSKNFKFEIISANEHIVTLRKVKLLKQVYLIL